MSVTSSQLPRYFPEFAWGGFALLSTLAVVALEAGETIPFHLVWVSLTLLYAFREWTLMTTLLVLSVVCVASGIALGWTVAQNSAGIDEISEVPLMAAMFLAMVFHSQRRQAALDAARRAADRELQLARDRDFVREASHGLRTPITVARGHAELILATHPSGETAEDARVILDELSRLNGISDRLLLLAVADHPAFLRPTTIQFEHFLNDTVARWKSAASRRWTLDIDARGSLGADEQRLGNALDALIENAVKFTRDADAITITGRSRGSRAVIEVTDTGEGISSDELPRIFDRFARGTSRLPNRAGTGLGLAIVKAIVEAHEGSIVVDSNLGSGTTFRLELPGFCPESEMVEVTADVVSLGPQTQPV
jgi:signal transduction histidine kinase